MQVGARVRALAIGELERQPCHQAVRWQQGWHLRRHHQPRQQADQQHARRGAARRPRQRIQGEPARGGAEREARRGLGQRMRADDDTRHRDQQRQHIACGNANRDPRRPRAAEQAECEHRIDRGGEHRMTGESGEVERRDADAKAEEGDLRDRRQQHRDAERQQTVERRAQRARRRGQPQRQRDAHRQQDSGFAEAGQRRPEHQMAKRFGTPCRRDCSVAGMIGATGATDAVLGGLAGGVWFTGGEASRRDQRRWPAERRRYVGRRGRSRSS